MLPGKTHLDASLRRTTDEASVAFVEERLQGQLRAMRCYRKDTIQAALDTCRGFHATPLPDGQHDGDTLPLNGLEFTWELRRKTWKFEGSFYAIEVMTTCCREDVESWLQAFSTAETQCEILHHGKRMEHLLGVTPDTNDRVADANTKNGEITWYILNNSSRLFAAALADATKAGPSPIQIPRMIHHEATHCYEPEMKDWLDALTLTVIDVDLPQIAQTLNPAYLPSCIDSWEEECDQLGKMKLRPEAKKLAKQQLDESLAAEFLVEAFVHVVIDRKPWTKEIWPAMDTSVGDMLKRELAQHATAQQAHQPHKRGMVRVMYAPKTILVSEEEQTDVSVSI
jgi:hypothetical protein